MARLRREKAPYRVHSDEDVVRSPVESPGGRWEEAGEPSLSTSRYSGADSIEEEEDFAHEADVEAGFTGGVRRRS